MDPKQQPTPPTDEAVAESLYARHEKIYPREVHGVYAGLRSLGVLGLLGIFYGSEWLRWDGHQALLLDLPARKFHIFGLTLWPQDFIYLAFLLILAGLGLFFVTALIGRVWCGYACPQTVWTEAFLWIERKVEGNRLQQMKLDKAPWDFRKLRIKGTKQFLWIIFSLWTGFTFVGYFTPIDELAVRLGAFDLGPWESFWVLFYGFATYGNAGWMREQVCKYMCPYARFQSAMFDDDTLIISYDSLRGEKRGSRKRSDDPKEKGLGSCIDCTLCVQVCPTGIDIRDGLQYECIACSACIDACDDVMDKMNYPRGLIRYTTQNTMDGKKTHIVRPRILIYAAILTALAGLFVYSILQRQPIELDVLRDRNQLFRETIDGRIENVYTLKIINMDQQAHDYQLSASGIPGLTLVTDGSDIHALSGEVVEMIVRLQADEGELEVRSTRVEFELTATDTEGLSIVEEARFLGPAP